MNVYEIITNKIIESLENGNVVWKKGWKTIRPKNYITKKEYTGINRLLLSMNNFGNPYYLTFKQINDLGGSVKKGEKSSIVVFWKNINDNKESENIEENENIKTHWMLRYYLVFNIEQTTLEIKPENDIIELKIIEKNSIENNIDNYLTREKIELKRNLGRCFYSITSDYISLPKKESFLSDNEYFSTLFHEIVHSTGHEKRLKRFQLGKAHNFGSETYSKEELVAEIGACFLNNHFNIDNVFENNVAYIKGWLEILNKDHRMIIQASSLAEKSFNYVISQ